MQKLSRRVLMVLMLVLPLFVFSQNPALQILNQNDIDALDSKMQNSLKRCHCFSKKDSIRLFTFFTLFAMDTISKEEYEDGSFLNKLTHGYNYFYINHPYVTESNYLKKDSVLCCSYHFIFSKKRDLIATFSEHDNRFICRKKGHDSFYSKLYTELIRCIWDKENIFVFQMIEKRSGFYFFIVNEQLEISVCCYDFNNKKYTILPVKEFIDKNWEEFYKANSGVLVGE